MSKKTKIWLITAASLVVVGLIIFASVMTVYGWDFTKLSTVKYETNTYEINEEFTNLSINVSTEDITFVPSEDGKCKIVCVEETNLKHTFKVEDKTLTIDKDNERKWYEYIGINIGRTEITVYLPQGEYGVLSVKASTGDVSMTKDFGFESIDFSVSTGDICVRNISAESLELSVSTGDIAVSDVSCEGDINIKVTTGESFLTDIKCKNLISKGSTGEISLRDVIADEKFALERSTGDIEFENCDADEIYIITDTGDVSGSLLSEKVFITRTDTGDIDVPKSTNGGRCEITTDTGDIEIDIE